MIESENRPWLVSLVLLSVDSVLPIDGNGSSIDGKRQTPKLNQ